MDMINDVFFLSIIIMVMMAISMHDFIMKFGHATCSDLSHVDWDCNQTVINGMTRPMHFGVNVPKESDGQSDPSFDIGFMNIQISLGQPSAGLTRT